MLLFDKIGEGNKKFIEILESGNKWNIDF